MTLQEQTKAFERIAKFVRNHGNRAIVTAIGVVVIGEYTLENDPKVYDDVEIITTMRAARIWLNY